MNYAKISYAQGIALILVIMLNHLILNLPKNLLVSCRFCCYFKCSFYYFINVFVFIYYY